MLLNYFGGKWKTTKSGYLTRVVLYFMMVVLLHDPMTQFSVWIMRGLTLPYYNWLIGFLVVAGLAAGAWFLLKSLRKNYSRPVFAWFLLFLTPVLLILHNRFLCVMNIEIIHFLEFGFLAVLVWPVFRNYSQAMFFTTLLSALDELWQYLVLYPDRADYFDFNDLVMNQLGMGFFLLVVYARGNKSTGWKSWKDFLYSLMVVTFLALTLVMGLMLGTGFIRPYADTATAQTWMVLNESMGPEKFWRPIRDPDLSYHVLRPAWGLAINLVLIALYSILDLTGIALSGER